MKKLDIFNLASIKAAELALGTVDEHRAAIRKAAREIDELRKQTWNKAIESAAVLVLELEHNDDPVHERADEMHPPAEFRRRTRARAAAAIRKLVKP